MQTSFWLEDTVVLLATPVGVLVDNPSAQKRANNVTNQARNIDQSVDVWFPIVRGCLQDKRIKDVDGHDPLGTSNALAMVLQRSNDY